jgi:glutathione S-transferase
VAGLRLHWSPDSANLPVRVALERLGLPFDGVRVDRARGEHRGAAYRALNPQGLIPVLEDGPLVLFETGAILLHLAERAGRLGPDGPPADAPGARAAFLSWLFWLSNTLHADLRVAFHADRHVGQAGRGALGEGVARRIAGHLDLLEEVLGEGGLAGPAPTLLDDYLGACLRWARLYPRAAPVLPEGIGRRPRIAGLLARIEGDAAVLRATAAESIPGARPWTEPEPPALPAAEVTG